MIRLFVWIVSLFVKATIAACAVGGYFGLWLFRDVIAPGIAVVVLVIRDGWVSWTETRKRSAELERTPLSARARRVFAGPAGRRVEYCGDD